MLVRQFAEALEPVRKHQAVHPHGLPVQAELPCGLLDSRRVSIWCAKARFAPLTFPEAICAAAVKLHNMELKTCTPDFSAMPSPRDRVSKAASYRAVTQQ